MAKPAMSSMELMMLMMLERDGEPKDPKLESLAKKGRARLARVSDHPGEAKELLEEMLAHRPKTASGAKELGGAALPLAREIDRALTGKEPKGLPKKYPREHLLRLGYRHGIERLKKDHPALEAALRDDLPALEAALKGRWGKSRANKPLFAAKKENDPQEAKIRGETHYAPMHLAALNDSAEAVDLLMKAGGNPKLFLAGVTPSGLAAYIGAAKALRAIAENGGDVVLELLPEHAPEAAGSTLLHRVMTREIANKKAILKVLADSGQYPPDLLPKDAKGRTPLDEIPPEDPARGWLLGLAAKAEKRRLETAAEPAAPGPKRQGI